MIFFLLGHKFIFTFFLGIHKHIVITEKSTFDLSYNIFFFSALFLKTRGTMVFFGWKSVLLVIITQ